ncbi:MAG: hypothetical protein IPN02_09980 [Candidatus Microthrix sp.]|uniref:Uncharacterized protein n=1 Tax=Candidatus Neomicrothrix subdominans TaxID=2954438 RepID=A0A936NCI1_9ACTN|nr:hypothetical protein [Candidatus Microthrix subdominans]
MRTTPRISSGEQLSTKLNQASTDLGINSTADLVKSSPKLEKLRGVGPSRMGPGPAISQGDDGERPEAQLSERLDEVLFASTESPKPDLGGVTSVPADAGAGRAATSPSRTSPPTEEPTREPGRLRKWSPAMTTEAGARNAASNERAFDPADVDLAQLKQLQSDLASWRWPHTTAPAAESSGLFTGGAKVTADNCPVATATATCSMSWLSCPGWAGAGNTARSIAIGAVVLPVVAVLIEACWSAAVSSPQADAALDAAPPASARPPCQETQVSALGRSMDPGHAWCGRFHRGDAGGFETVPPTT